MYSSVKARPSINPCCICWLSHFCICLELQKLLRQAAAAILSEMDASSGVYSLFQSSILDLLSAGRVVSQASVARAAQLSLNNPLSKRSGLPAQLMAALLLSPDDLTLGLKLTLAIYATPIKHQCCKCNASRLVLRSESPSASGERVISKRSNKLQSLILLYHRILMWLPISLPSGQSLWPCRRQGE